MSATSFLRILALDQPSRAERIENFLYLTNVYFTIKIAKSKFGCNSFQNSVLERVVAVTEEVRGED